MPVYMHCKTIFILMLATIFFGTEPDKIFYSNRYMV